MKGTQSCSVRDLLPADAVDILSVYVLAKEKLSSGDDQDRP